MILRPWGRQGGSRTGTTHRARPQARSRRPSKEAAAEGGRLGRARLPSITSPASTPSLLMHAPPPAPCQPRRVGPRAAWSLAGWGNEVQAPAPFPRPVPTFTQQQTVPGVCPAWQSEVGTRLGACPGSTDHLQGREKQTREQTCTFFGLRACRGGRPIPGRVLWLCPGESKRARELDTRCTQNSAPWLT